MHPPAFASSIDGGSHKISSSFLQSINIRCINSIKLFVNAVLTKSTRKWKIIRKSCLFLKYGKRSLCLMILFNSSYIKRIMSTTKTLILDQRFIYIHNIYIIHTCMHFFTIFWKSNILVRKFHNAVAIFSPWNTICALIFR
jgi:hypothetical protein